MTRSSRILVIDDSDEALLIARSALEDGDFEAVEVAASAADAFALLDLASADPVPAFDCILLDIVMPGIDGVEACAAIRLSRRYRDVPIVMVSGKNDVETLNQAFIAGANDYVGKPISQIELLSRVRSSLRFKREIDRRRAREAELRTRGGRGDDGAAAIGIDDDTGLANRALVEARIVSAAAAEIPTALLLLAIDGFGEYRLEHGEDAAARLVARIACELARLPAPLGATLGLFDEGQFLVVAPDADSEPLVRLAAAAARRMDALALPHGASAAHDYVCLHEAIGSAAGAGLRQLPGDLIARLAIAGAAEPLATLTEPSA